MAALLEVDGLEKRYRVGGGRTVRAVDGVSFEIRRGETLALVGESGCGKTTTAELVLALQPASAGRVTFDGRAVIGASGAQMRRLRREMQVVFQNPRSSLNPRMRIHELLAEPLALQGVTKADMPARVAAELSRVKLEPALAPRFPHEVSGGQAQRVAIARALAVGPRFIVLDEPTSALDVSVQAQIVNLLHDLQTELGLTYLFISHDLRIVRHLSDRVAIMYLGKVVERGPTAALFAAPKHPYTRALLSAVPRANPWVRRERFILQGELPSPTAVPSGCRFRTRCPLAEPRCGAIEPPLTIGPGDRAVACHLAS